MKRLQAVDQRLGPLACVAVQPLAFARRLRRRPLETPQRILCVKFWGLGSLQLLTPAVTSLREQYAGARIDLLTLSANAEFARGLGTGDQASFDDVLTLDVTGAGWAGLAWRAAGLVGTLRARGYDLVIDFEFFTRFSALVSLLSGAPRLAGFHAPSVWRGGFRGRRVTFNRYWHVARNFRALAGAEDGSEVGADELASFRLTEADRAELDDLLLEAGAAPERQLVVLNPNAGSLSLERRWPRERFVALGQAMLDHDGVVIVLVGSSSEAEYTGPVAAAMTAAPGRVLDLSGRLSIAASCALFERADLVVSNDSGPMHIAAALGAPTIGLFGPETPVMYRPLGKHVTALWDPPVCSPCINVHDNKRSTCIYGQPECLMNLSVGSVLGTARRMLEGELLRPVGPPREDLVAERRRRIERDVQAGDSP